MRRILNDPTEFGKPVSEDIKKEQLDSECGSGELLIELQKEIGMVIGPTDYVNNSKIHYHASTFSHVTDGHEEGYKNKSDNRKFGH